MINGKHTLWDLAAKMQQNVLAVTNSLRPFINKGIAEFIEVSDVELSIIKVRQKAEVKSGKKNNYYLIACIDDSLQMSKILEKMVTSEGMMFISIQDPLQALPILIESKPDLIFLDLIMPVVNGYQICEQLRHISFFTKTPIIILTSSDGVFDRVRAKVFGATDFINKPVEKERLMGILDKYLQRNETQPPQNLAWSY
ncbi:response regulator [Anabaena sp. UHCC 0253]|uniref:response regulator n=1 Tax=Anabaena sp. UHCC 0253 TaxID=2590019 RepID=UPI0020C2F953|nr:response regulator [Anabaena sp. UHCC 0253]